MNTIHVDEKVVHGLAVRTTNANEMQPTEGKIGPLWHRFCEQVASKLEAGATVYSVYHDYASDANGAYSVLAGSDQLDPSTIDDPQTATIQSGQYMVFTAKGEMPQVVIDTWQKIWNHFSNPNMQEQRAFTTDFEKYKSQNDCEIYISIKS